MHLKLLLALGAVLHLGHSGTIPRINCIHDPNLNANGTELLDQSVRAPSEVSDHCIENFCSGKKNRALCEPFSLHVTNPNSPLFDGENCVNELHSIINICIEAEGAFEGYTRVNGVEYRLSLKGQDRGEDNKRRDLYVLKRQHHARRSGRPPPRYPPSGSRVSPPPGYEGQRPRSRPPPSGSRPPQFADDEKFSGRWSLVPDRVMQFEYHQNDPNWREKDIRPSTGRILDIMNPTGKFDIIEIKDGELEVVGDPRRRIDPAIMERRGGDYLLCNGGFFNIHDPERRLRHLPIGETSLNDEWYPPHPLYENDFVEIQSENGEHWLQSGPDLTPGIDISEPRFQYRNSKGEKNEHANYLGNLAHAGDPNERIVIGFYEDMTSVYTYVFTYTCEARGCGMKLDKMKELIDEFMGMRWRNQFRRFRQLVNLDGGGSVYMSWNFETRDGPDKEAIAQGNNREGIPSQQDRRRHVGNLIKISV